MPGVAEHVGQLFQVACPVGQDQAVSVLAERGGDVRDDLAGALLVGGQVPVDGSHPAGAGWFCVTVVPVGSRVDVQDGNGPAGAG